MLTDRQREALPALGLPDVRFDVPLAPLTRLGIGGPADALVVVPDDDALTRLARWTRRERLALTPLERGTDALIRDGGLAGVVVLLGEGFAQVEAGPRGVVVGGAASAADAMAHLDGAPPWLRGVQGTVGAALLREPHDAAGVREVAVVLGRGVRQEIPAEELKRGERRLGLRDEAVLASVTLEPGDHSAAERVPARLPGVRLFDDPRKGSDAAELLGRSGLLGVRVRGARLDDVMPNRLLAEEGASAHDVEVLVDWAIRKVASEWGVQLRSALRVFGRRPEGGRASAGIRR